MQPALQPIVRFGSFELRSTQRVLLMQGSPVPLGSRALDVLVALVARRGDLVTKDELLNIAWPGLVVEEANVHVAVSQLRKVLGKPAISTVGGLGYRFALPLHTEAPVEPVAPVVAVVAVMAGLPPQRSAFVGRQAELADAGALLQHTRLLTLVAMGGMGKTRLALQLAQQLQVRYADGVCFVDLQPLHDGTAVPAAVARALGLGAGAATAGGATAADATDVLLRHLQQRQLLLVLDNCEHLLPAVRTLLAALLSGPQPSLPHQQTAGTHVLATSRQALELPGERVFALRPLQLPGADEAAPQALGCEAVQMFMQRVLEDNPGFAVDASGGANGGVSGGASNDASGALMLDICRRLDGIPLALELAAARLKMLSLQQLHTLLAQRFVLLSRSGPAGAARQRTLQEVLQWSHEHLAAAEQTVAQTVAVCAGGFDLDTAVALQPGSPGSPTSAAARAVAVLDSLAQLADRALIQVVHGGDAARYGQLETVREYLLAQLATTGQLQAARQRHLLHFHTLALRAEAATASGTESGDDGGSDSGKGGAHEGARWAARLDTERDNLLAALAFSRLPGAAPECQQRGLEMVAALKNFWFASGWLDQGLRAAAGALAQVPALQPTLLSARVQRLAAQLCLFMSRLDEGALYARQALAASQRLGDEAGAAAALCFAGRIAVKSEDTASGEQLLQEGLRRARAAQALAVVGEALNALAFAAIERDDLSAAEAHFAEALLASQQRGSTLGGVIETLNLAWVTVSKVAVQMAAQTATKTAVDPIAHETVKASAKASSKPAGTAALEPSPPPPPRAELERARQLLLSVWQALQRRPHRYVAQELIDVCASFALQCGCSEAAALLHGASAAQRQALQLPLTAKQAARRATEATAVCAHLGEAGYEAAAAQGRQQPHAQTLARLGTWLQQGPSPQPI